MQKLSAQNIQFIKKYLKTSGVEYLDIRMEMTDHVASEIESRMAGGDPRGFYTIFKEYMIKHKADLLKSLKNFRRQADKKVIFKVIHNLYNWKTLTTTGILALAMNYLAGEIIVKEGSLKLFVMLSILALYLLPVFLIGKIKYIYLDRLNFTFGLVLYSLIVLYDAVPYLQQHSLFYLTGFMLVYFSVVKTLLDLCLFYKKNYQVT